VSQTDNGTHDILLESASRLITNIKYHTFIVETRIKLFISKPQTALIDLKNRILLICPQKSII